MEYSSTNEAFYEELKLFFKNEGLEVVQEDQMGSDWSFATALVGISNGPNERFYVTLESKRNYLYVTIRLAYPVSASKVNELMKILNKLNFQQLSGCFFLNEITSTVDMSCGFFLNGSETDIETFEKYFGDLHNLAESYFPLIHEFLTGKKNEKTIYDEILKTVIGAIAYENKETKTWN